MVRVRRDVLTMSLWFAKIRFADSGLTFISIQSKNRGPMPDLVLFLFRLARLLFSGHAAAVENLLSV